MSQIKFQSQEQIIEQFEQHILIKSQLGIISYGIPTPYQYQIVPDEPIMQDYYEIVKNNQHTHLIGSRYRLNSMKKALSIDFFGIPGKYEEDCYEFYDKKLYKCGMQNNKKSIDDLVTFHAFNSENQVIIETKKVNLNIEKKGKKYIIYQNGIHLTDIEFKITIEKIKRNQILEIQPPDMGVTYIDQKYPILWLNSKPILLDPPTDYNFQGSIILTSKNDKGVFDLIIHSKNIEVISTPKIMRQFLEKYKALAGYEYLQDLVEFRAVRIEGVTRLFGVSFRFSYNKEFELDFQIANNGQTLNFIHEKGVIQEQNNQKIVIAQSTKKSYLKKLFLLENSFKSINLEDLKWILEQVVLETYNPNDCINNTKKLYILLNGVAKSIENQVEVIMYPGDWIICNDVSISILQEATFYTLEQHDLSFIFSRNQNNLFAHKWHPFQILFRNPEFQRLENKQEFLQNLYPQETYKSEITLNSTKFNHVLISGCLEYDQISIIEPGTIVIAQGYCKIKTKGTTVLYKLFRN